MSGPSSATARGPSTARRERWALLASSLLVLATVVAQAPGRIVPETKLDLVADPARYLGRALSAWDPAAGFGRVQNQAAGYLFPMGPFYALGHLLGVPGWLVQRAWITVVVLVGLWGAHRLARAIGVATASGRLVAAWAYALAPATLAVAGFQSAGQLPYALAPWVLVPLVEAGPGDRPRRVATRSALAVAAMGGVNGASALAVLPLAAVWLATRAPGPARRRLVAWWAGAVLAATLWWLVPLVVSVRYGLNFTDFTETASQTTGTESAVEVLRGTGNWLGYLHGPGGYWLPGARELTVAPWAVVGSTLVAAGGVAGLARRDAPGRAWLLPSALVGAILLGIGYGGPLGGSFSGIVQDLLDGPLAPFRNVHKFSAVLRLPLAVGLGHLVATASARLGADRSVAPAPAVGARMPVGRAVLRAGVAAPVLAVGLVLAGIAPLAAGRVTAPGSFAELPEAWRDAAAWLDDHDDGGRALVVPGSTFAEYRWGRPLDEPLGALARSDWAVRDLIPLGGNGSTRVLDGIDRALQGDALPPGFASTLQRAGVRHLVVRNDLDLERTGGPRPATVRRLLETDPELELAASFGRTLTDVDDDHRTGPTPGDDGAPYREVDVWDVAAPPGSGDPRVASYPTAGTLVVGGGPEALLQLPPELVEGRGTVLAVDEAHDGRLGEGRVPLATDTAQRRDVAFGTIRDNVTYPLTAEERSPRSGQEPTDLWPADEPIGLTVAEVDGAATLADSDPVGPLADPEHQPFAAFDDDASTAWVPGDERVGEWVEATFDAPREVDAVTVRLPLDRGRRIGSVTVTTDGGERTAAIAADGTATVSTAPGDTTRVRLTIASIIEGTDLGPVGLAEVALDGTTIRRPLRAAPVWVGRDDGPTVAAAASFQRSRRDRYDTDRSDEEGRLDRLVELDGDQPVELTGTASSRPGSDLDHLLGDHLVGGSDPIEVDASSRWRDLPAFDPAAALDGDPATAWISAAEGTAPELRLSWEGATDVAELTLTGLDGGVEPIDRVAIVAGDEQVVRTVPASGRITFPSVRTDRLVLAFPGRTGGEADRRVGVAEVAVPALAGRASVRPDPEATVDLPCGQGPDLRVDGELVPTRASTTAGVLRDGGPVAWTACRPLDLATGPHRFDASPTGALVVDQLLVVPDDGLPTPGPARPVAIDRWDAEHRTLTVGPGEAAVVATSENFNDGWTATLDGRELPTQRVDGWRQGWVVPAGDGGRVVLTFTPGRSHRFGLALGALGLVALLVAASVPGRRRRDPEATEPTGHAEDAGAAPAIPAVPALPAERSWGEPAALGLAVVAGVALAGPLVLLLLPLLALPRRSRWLPVVAAAGTAAAGVAVLLLPDAEFGTHVGAFSAGPQAPALLAVLALAAALVPEREEVVSPAAGSTPSNRGRFGRRWR